MVADIYFPLFPSMFHFSSFSTSIEINFVGKGLKLKSNNKHIKAINVKWWLNDEIPKQTLRYYHSPYLCNKDRL
ncbi:hypothetical protein MTR_7g058780 [Medicago truncatula]|uniref:Uncharacterized protein n=1 Tax=Medicago truncatula TaxID=3880 RepID=G7L1B9_MEDTR|nr:hypothetical protein MTR_7g058780 [Medicago truncatula]